MNVLLWRSFGLSRVILFDKQHSALMNQQQSHSHHVTQSGIAYNLQNLACNCNPPPNNEKTLLSLFNWCKNPPSLSVQKPLNTMKFQSQLNIPSSFWHKSLMYCEIKIKLDCGWLWTNSHGWNWSWLLLTEQNTHLGSLLKVLGSAVAFK